jgi:hypothetical protein
VPGHVGPHALGCAALSLLGLLGVAGGLAGGAVHAQRPPSVAPALGIIPANASRITATVLISSVWPPGSLGHVPPAVRPDRTLYSLTLRVLAAAPADPGVSSRAQPGDLLEAFSGLAPDADLLGQRITAVVRLTGTTRATRWEISEIEVVP